MVHGIYVAVFTPFQGQQLDTPKFTSHLEHLIQQGVHGLVPCGTTGEAPTLSREERQALLEICCKTVRGRVPIMAGVGTASTAETIQLAQEAERLHVDSLLVVSPYYNKPTQEGIFQHYKTIHDHTQIPIFLYSNPGRCGTEIAVETVVALGQLPRIQGIKDATTDLSRCIAIRQHLGATFIQLTGEDASAGAYLAAGGNGCISVGANIAPQLYCQLYNAWTQGDLPLFQRIQMQLAALNKALFCQTNPIPLKYAASVLGLCSNELRLPLLPLEATYYSLVQNALKTLEKK